MNMQSPRTGIGSNFQCTGLSVSFCRARYATMLLLLIVATLTGCTNLQPVAMDYETLQEQIRDGTVVQEGETVRVVTRDGVSHLIVVTAVEENALQGHATGAKPGAIEIDIPVDEILVLEKEKVNAAETAAGSLGVTAILVAVLLIMIPSIAMAL